MIEAKSPSSRRHRRCFQRVISGLEKGGELRLITLTSSPGAPQDIQRSFRKLIMRLKRRDILKDYIKVIENTENGAQHIHMCFRGSYIEQRYLSALWSDIHSSKIVDIRQVKGRYRDKKNVAHYLAKYMSKEDVRRYSWSWGWVYKGFVKVWVAGLKINAQTAYFLPDALTFKHFLSLWKAHLRSGSEPRMFIQSLLATLYVAQDRAWAVARAERGITSPAPRQAS